MSATLTFLGAAGTVTGSKHYLQSEQTRLLLDCGLFQGLKELRLRNWAPCPVPAASIGGVLLSHAHIDHSGALPRLGREGFRGPIYCTPGTADLLKIMLPDAAHLQEEQAQFANRHQTSKHRPALPLFTTADADRVLTQVRPVGFDATFSPAQGVSARFINAGHILGAGLVEVSINGRTLVFSGDLGRYGVPIMRDPDPVPAADVLLVESTYGNRLHPAGDHRDRLTAAVQRTVEKKGWLLIPAFAVGRSQEILYDLRELEDAVRIPSLPVYLDSPMAIEATVTYARHPEEHDQDLKRVEASGERPFAPKQLRICKTPDDSKRLNDTEGPGIIIAGSGMATGGRILHHFVRRLPDERTTVLFVGYQAAGTRGRLLREGAREVKMLGQSVPVRAAIMVSDSYSAHADQGEILRWLGGFTRPPQTTYIVHGEPDAAAALQARIASQLKWRAVVAQDGQRVDLG
ncbi:MAG: MBL fold metallo-hydrolase [Candidatus Rokubacteria bacterium]|nr:MBL fold metallo-hydrolase [Candidatus Rokubacteria bacterium]